MKKNRKYGSSFLKFFLMALSAFLFVLIASATTSPVYPNYKGWDSGLFQVIGKGWLAGHVPYQQLYDQKGPIIFFINMLGYALTGNKYGVFLIQIVFMFFSVVIIYKICRRVYRDWIALCIAVFGIFVFSCNYEMGNLCEEYANPLLLLCLYLVTKWLEAKSEGLNVHKPLFAFVYGITFGFCMMSRLTNSIGVCVAVFFIMLYLICNKEFANLLKNALLFITGFALMVVPFVIYFAVKGATYDFWYGTLLYNIAYATNSNGGIMNIIKGSPSQIGSYAIMAVGVLCFLRKRYFDGALYFSLGAITELLLMNLMNYGHYSMITFAYLSISVYEFKKILDDLKANSDKMVKTLKISTILIMTFVILIAVARTGKEFKKLSYYCQRYSMTSQADAVLAYKQLLDVVATIPEEDRNSIVGYGTNPWFYLDMDITPACRFFVMQDWQAEFSDDFRTKLIAEFEEKKPKWIVFADSREACIDSVLKKYYEQYMVESAVNSQDGGQIVLYRLR